MGKKPELRFPDIQDNARFVEEWMCEVSSARRIYDGST